MKLLLLILTYALPIFCMAKDNFDYLDESRRLNSVVAQLKQVVESTDRRLTDMLAASKDPKREWEDSAMLRHVTETASRQAKDISLLSQAMGLAANVPESMYANTRLKIYQFCSEVGLSDKSGEQWIKSNSETWLGLRADYPAFAKDLREISTAYKSAGQAGIDACARTMR